MIDRTEILEFAKILGLRADIVEKDYVLGWLLSAINRHPSIKDQWIFKGGTCLKKCYFETYRFSEDLDFTLRDPSHISEEFLRPVFEEISSSLYEVSGIEVPANAIAFDVFTNSRGKTSVQGKVGYIGPLRIRGTVPRIKLDLSNDEALILAPQKQRVFHPYTDDPPEGLTAYCYSFEEVFAEKTRALAERARPRDLYDVIHLYRRIDLLTNKELFFSTLQRKCEFKGIGIPTFVDIEQHTKRTELNSEWDNMLAHQLEELPPLEHFWKELPEFFSWLHEIRGIPTLPGYQQGAGESIWNPGRMSRTSSSVIQKIQFAAANRVCIRLGYSGKLRLVEPYSLRTSREGVKLFYGFNREDNQMMCFRVDHFESVEITKSTFTPRYSVQIS
jgi:predicted nucleotidyltransferase component of viral defense system